MVSDIECDNVVGRIIVIEIPVGNKVWMSCKFFIALLVILSVSTTLTG